MGNFVIQVGVAPLYLCSMEFAKRFVSRSGVRPLRPAGGDLLGELLAEQGGDVGQDHAG